VPHPTATECEHGSVTRRYVVPLEDGSYAIPTVIRFHVGIGELAVGVALATRTDRGYRHGPQVQRVTGETYWSIEAIDTARRLAAEVGRRSVMAAVRAVLERSGYSAFAGPAEFERFPREVARERAAELWPALDPDAGPFGGSIGNDVGGDRRAG